MDIIASLIDGFGHTLWKIIPISIGLGVVFTILTSIWACNPGRPWWRSPDLATDLCYWFVIPLITRYLRIGFMVLGAALVFGVTTAEGLIALYDNGHGPLSRLPLWVQMILFLVVSDFMLYWIHRAFHRGPLWKYHAVHHSTEDLHWLSAARFHPVNLFLGSVMVDVVLFMAGISTNVFLVLGPFTIAHSALVHANLNWTFGPLRYVLASPVFHRWHHTAIERGGMMNYAGTFPLWDLLFGTFYMPKNQLPDHYGVADPDFPQGFGGQLIYPFKQ